MNAGAEPHRQAAACRDYKRLLRNVLDRRPSGTRHRLAIALGKNRSFVSQISNPAYPVPIPARHLGIIFEICHFSPAEEQEFLEVFTPRIHPSRRSRMSLAHEPELTFAPDHEVADLGDAETQS